MGQPGPSFPARTEEEEAFWLVCHVPDRCSVRALAGTDIWMGSGLAPEPWWSRRPVRWSPVRARPRPHRRSLEPSAWPTRFPSRPQGVARPIGPLLIGDIDQDGPPRTTLWTPSVTWGRIICYGWKRWSEGREPTLLAAVATPSHGQHPAPGLPAVSTPRSRGLNEPPNEARSQDH
jgi:hypothetical protein